MPKRKLMSCAVVAVAAIGLAACGDSGGSGDTGSTSGQYSLEEIDVTPGYFYLPAYVIRTDTGKNHNLTVSASSVTGGGAGDTQFAGGRGDIMLAGMNSAVRFFEKKAVDVTVLGTVVSTNVTALVSKAGSPYRALADLKGRNLGIFGAGGVTDLALRQQLLAADMDPNKDVHLVALGAPAAQLAALQSGSADAVQLTEPILGQQLSAGKIQVVDDMRRQGYAAVTVLARTKDVKKNPKAYCAYQSALGDAMQKLINDPDYAATAGAALMGQAVSAADNKIQYQEAVSSTWEPHGKFTQAQYDSTKQILVATGAFKDDGFPTYQDLVKDNPAC
jgi:ABC-type nitrate/sulfonate/bicarbonate transport system substrate-binding protein